MTPSAEMLPPLQLIAPALVMEAITLFAMAPAMFNVPAAATLTAEPEPILPAVQFITPLTKMMLVFRVPPKLKTAFAPNVAELLKVNEPEAIVTVCVPELPPANIPEIVGLISTVTV